MNRTTRSNQYANKVYKKKHRFEHWYRDNQIYFITARCHKKFPAFASDRSKDIFWDRFEHYTKLHQFTPWVTSLLNNHYHTLGYLKFGKDLPLMMRKIHGSVAKLVNDVLKTETGGLKSPCPEHAQSPYILGLKPFWGDGEKTYFDGCIRDIKQANRAYTYVLRQSERHHICSAWREYTHTRINIEHDCAIKRACELSAFLEGVPYKRYQRFKHGD